MKTINSMRVIAMASLICTAVFAADAGDKTEPVAVQKTCPVMGGKINKALFVDYKGQRIYVCCGGCIAKIKADPDKYISVLEKQGVVLDDVPVEKPVE